MNPEFRHLEAEMDECYNAEATQMKTGYPGGGAMLGAREARMAAAATPTPNRPSDTPLRDNLSMTDQLISQLGSELKTVHDALSALEERMEMILRPTGTDPACGGGVGESTGIPYFGSGHLNQRIGNINNELARLVIVVRQLHAERIHSLFGRVEL